MSRESEIRFSELPTIDIERSKFERPSDLKLSFNTGELIPILVDEVLPGDTVNIDMGSIIRMTTPVFPVMDNCFADIYFFFVPNRLVWNHFREFMGENRSTHWEQPIEYTIPQIKAPEAGWAKGTLADYFGLPTKVPNIEVTALPFRAYSLIWNEWFRSEALQDPIYITMDETLTQGINQPKVRNYVTDIGKGAYPANACKIHDYFTSALPAPQCGPSVLIPISNDNKAIVKTSTDVPGAGLIWTTETRSPMVWGGVTSKRQIASEYGITTNNEGMSTVVTNTQARGEGVVPINLYADLSSSGIGSINELRQAFAIQRYYEILARSGNRYIEQVKSIFGVTSSDARMQRPEYIGGYRQHINMDQVLQTSGTTEVSPQGNTAAFSCTCGAHEIGTYSAQEHGILMGLMVVRTDLTYQQGIEKYWTRKDKFDFYIPQFANLGEQPIKYSEVYAQGNEEDDWVFGYQEAWADYRYKPSKVVGALRSNYDQTLDSWHYADYYSSKPYLSMDWIAQGKQNVDRTLAVSSELEDQFIGDIHFNNTWVRPMPLYSIPGLIDHH